jgi:uncharacterized membrane protein (UPF0127 family)
LPLRRGQATPSAGAVASGRGEALVDMVAFLATDTDDPAVAARRARLPRTVRIVAGDDIQVCSRCEVAERTIARMRGLLGRDGLGPGEGMLIKHAPSVMTFFMRFPIDVVFVDKTYKIVKIVHSLGPWKTAAARKAVAALELPAGTAAALHLEPGMTLRLTDDGATS